MSWYDDYIQKVTINGLTIRDQRINIKNNLFSSTFKNAPEYQRIGLGSINNMFDSWIFGGEAYKLLINQKKLSLEPTQLNIPLNFFNGQYVYWNINSTNEIWIIIFSDINSNDMPTCTIEKCNNTLKWIDDNGNLQQFPCVINSLMSFYRNLYTTSIATSQATISMFCQSNQFTKTISQNRRFIFNGIPYKVEAINNFMNKSANGNDAPLLELFMFKDEINLVTDDVINNIANYNSTLYTVVINQGTTLNQTVGYTTTLTSTIRLNSNVITNQPITWSSSNPLVGSINSTTGIINLLTVGNVTFTATMSNNLTVSSSISVTVASVPIVVSANVILPNITSLKQTVSQTYSINKIINGVANADTFIFSQSGANPTHYQFSSINGNSFTVLNKGYDAVPLVVRGINIVDASSIFFTINLKGLY